MVDEDRVSRARCELEAIIHNLPMKYVPSYNIVGEDTVVQYQGVLDELTSAGLDVSRFRFERGSLKPGGVAQSYARTTIDHNQPPREAPAPRGLFANRSRFLTAADGLLRYLREREAPAMSNAPEGRSFSGFNINATNVTLGDGSAINITTITISQLLEALREHVDRTVHDPAQKKTLIGKISDVLKHPAATTALQASLPELLKVLKS
jgi:hypothetical protein